MLYCIFAYDKTHYKIMIMNAEKEMKIGLFVGSFDPFTLGHDSIVRRALPLFDKIVIGIGVNEHKQYMQTTEERMKTIQGVYADKSKIEVKAYTDLTIDFAKREGATYFIKGVRSVKDFEYEREQADINRQLGGIETLFLVAEPHLANISSSLVRELIHFGRDVSDFLPKNKD
ncbi:pantetheine-phosphate adenylyltransferase [Prevotella disiens JCM 6334 = ATCC 29426]|nr:pantetheine-phosphate adenylyltransferase [Prevotella disiens JCM 6334 = ATCC 29426]